MSLFMPAVYVAVPAVAAVLALVLATLAWRHRPAPGAGPFAVLFLAAAEWSAAYALELASTTAAGTLFWSQVSYAGILLLPAAWLVFAMDYTGRTGWRSPVVLGLLAVEPLVMFSLVWAEPGWDVVWTAITPIAFGGTTVFAYSHGIGFWLATAYAYTLLLAGAVLLVRTFRRAPVGHRKRIAAILLGAAIPWIGNVAFSAGIEPSPPLNLTHLGFALGGVAFFWVFFGTGFTDLAAASTRRVFETMDTAVLVLDPSRRVADLNPAAAELLGVHPSAVVGRPVEEVLGEGGEDLFAPTDDRLYSDELVLSIGGQRRRIAVDLASLYYPISEQRMGQLLYLRDDGAMAED